MNLLAIELTSARSSLALFCDDQLRAERNWPRDQIHNQHVFTALNELLEQARLPIERIDVFAVGRGPGNYSGMRLGLSMAQSLALPGQKEVYAISSGAALAYEVSRETSCHHIAVAGNARRDQFWLGLFERTTDSILMNGDWRLISPADLASSLPADCQAVSPDWPTLAPFLGQPASGWITEERYPHAQFLGQLVADKIRARIPSESLTPIYLHAAV